MIGLPNRFTFGLVAELNRPSPRGRNSRIRVTPSFLVIGGEEGRFSLLQPRVLEMSSRICPGHPLSCKSLSYSSSFDSAIEDMIF